MEEDNLKTRLTLLGKIKDRHDSAAWEDFVHYYKRYIYNVLRSMRLYHNEAEELSQKIIIKLWNKLPDFEYSHNKGKFRTWLYAVITNEVRNRVRSSQIQAKYFDKDNSSKLEAYADLPCEPEVVQIADQEWSVYVSNLAWTNLQSRMPEKYIQVFQLHINGKSTSEISTELSMKNNTVLVYKKRAKEQLIAEIKLLNEELL